VRPVRARRVVHRRRGPPRQPRARARQHPVLPRARRRARGRRRRIRRRRVRRRRGETGDPDTGGLASTSGGDTPGPETSPGIDVVVTVDTKWETGECDTVTVTNTTDAPISWQVVLDKPGTIQNAWNAKYTQMDTTFVWVGEPYNAELAGKAATSFGFCLND
jgi:hypothetical protein